MRITNETDAMNATYMRECLSGRILYGDDLSEDAIDAWFDDEKEGFADLGAKNHESYCYEYHGLNTLHGFRHLPSKLYGRTLCVGGAYGEEVKPFLENIRAITILEPSGAFRTTSLDGVPIEYVKPLPTGIMPFEDGTFDLATCFGCLHHIPNVGTVLRELHRCMKPNGFALVREPIISMGDWRRPRKGLTRRERGIPLPVFRVLISDAGFSIEKETLCGFSVTSRLGGMLGKHFYNSPTIVRIDQLLAELFAWNYRYHPVTAVQKFMPTVAAFVLRKP
ncbi:MAG: methyltransferase domain-containing protein [Nitrospira sp.]|nr:methyltransferase domain-containing protein [Nitrospira sp.]